MRALDDRVVVELGPALISLCPPEPWIWQEASPRAPGPASLCLELLNLAQVSWRGVAWAGQTAARPSPGLLAALPAAGLGPLLRALCPPWLTPTEAAGLQALERYLLSLADYPGLNCAACREQEARGEGLPDCAACPRPSPPPQAQPALSLYPLLSALPGHGAWAAGWLGGLSPRQARLLAMRLALIERLRPRRPLAPPLAPEDQA